LTFNTGLFIVIANELKYFLKREIGDVAIKKRVLFLLIISFFISIFVGSQHHFCRYHSQTCSLSSFVEPMAVLSTVTADDSIAPAVLGGKLLPSAIPMPDDVSSIASMKVRAPPISS